MAVYECVGGRLCVKGTAVDVCVSVCEFAVHLGLRGCVFVKFTEMCVLVGECSVCTFQL